MFDDEYDEDDVSGEKDGPHVALIIVAVLACGYAAARFFGGAA